MRLWVDPERLAALNLTAGDVANAVREQNMQVAAGHFGQQPTAAGQPFEFTITTLGRLSDPEQFDDIVLRTDADGRQVRVKDVGHVELGARNLDIDQQARRPAQRQPRRLRAARRQRHRHRRPRPRQDGGAEEELSRRTSTTRSRLDMTPFIQESINEVIRTLIEAIVLVAIVVLVFLQNWRSALIPLVAVPVAIVGTFAVMAAIGFSLNNLTLFGLVLAIGIVVDDAIVVVEAVEHHIEAGHDAAPGGPQGDGRGVRAGRRRGPGAVGGVRAVRLHQRHHRAVLPPVRPDHRRLDRHLGLQLADAQPGPGGHPAASRAGRRRTCSAGCSTCSWAGSSGCSTGASAAPPASTPAWSAWRCAAASMVLVVYGGLLVLTWWTSTQLPTGYIPNQDQGRFYIAVQLPDAASLERTQEVIDRISELVQPLQGVVHTHRDRRPVVHPQRQRLQLRPTSSSPSTTSTSAAIRRLYSHGHHRPASQDMLDKEVPEAQVSIFTPPPVSGLGSASGFKIIIEDRGDLGLVELQEADRAAHRTVSDRATRSRTCSRVFRANVPQLYVDLNRDQCQTMGVNPSDVFDTLQIYLGSLLRQRLQPVRPHLAGGRPGRRARSATTRTRSSCSRCATPAARWCRWAPCLSVREIGGPINIGRYNMYPAAAILGGTKPGVSPAGHRGDGAAVPTRCCRRAWPSSGPRSTTCRSTPPRTSGTT